MTADATDSKNHLSHLYRREYTKMTAVLCRHFGVEQMEIAEDIVSETFLKAGETWPAQGLPENPQAWLYTVAANKARDVLRRTKTFEQKVVPQIGASSQFQEGHPDFSEQGISDSQLAMMFAICNAALPAEAQICLALQVLCGFRLEEIAKAFLTKNETIKKRLQRAKERLRREGLRLDNLGQVGPGPRMEQVLRILYLLFNEGYYSQSGNGPVRRELCSEAMQLALLLAENKPTCTPQVNALLALMCYQCSRLDARESADGETILYDAQDQDHWSQELIQRGHHYLVQACTAEEISKYHLEAGIAYWHTRPGHPDKWKHILNLYNQLILEEYSPVTALNRVFALEKVYGKDTAIREAEKLRLEEFSHYHSLLGYLYSGKDPERSRTHYRTAMKLSTSASEKKILQRKLEQHTC